MTFFISYSFMNQILNHLVLLYKRCTRIRIMSLNTYNNNVDIIWHYCQPETPILAQGSKARGLIWVEGRYGMWYEKCHIIAYLSYTSMRLSSYLWELIVFRNGFNHVGWFGIWCNPRPILALGPSTLGLIWASRVDMTCDMKNVIE
jgi:hypothetical protein